MKKLLSAVLCLTVACIMILAGCKQALKNAENLLDDITAQSSEAQEDEDAEYEFGETESNAKKPQKTTSKSESAKEYTEIPESMQNEFSRYTYSFLNRTQKEYYKAIVAAAEELNTEKFLISKSSLKDGDVSDNISLAFTCVLADRPDLFWLKSGIKTFSRSDTKDVYAQLEYYVSGKKELENMRNELDNAVNDLLEACDDCTYFEKEVYFHNYICENTDYKNISDFSRTAYGVLIEGAGTCEGYSKAMQLLSNSAEINCITVRGADYEGNPHMWNKLEISGEWYALDVTWDDPVNTNTTSFKYFNITDKQMEKTHKTDITYTADTLPETLDDLEFNFCLPKASGTEYSAKQIGK